MVFIQGLDNGAEQSNKQGSETAMDQEEFEETNNQIETNNDDLKNQPTSLTREVPHSKGLNKKCERMVNSSVFPCARERFIWKQQNWKKFYFNVKITFSALR